MNYEEQIRATFETTKKAQEKLRVKLDYLEENNLCIPIDYRGDFFKLLADALLGFEGEKNCVLYLPDGTCLKIENVGEFIRYLAYNTNTDIEYDWLKRYGKIEKINVKIKEIWHELKFVIFSIYPEALNVSVRISKEQTHLGAAEAREV
jgi:hypothetical protein